MGSLREDKDGLPVKSTRAGESICPLSMAALMERTPMKGSAGHRKALPAVSGDDDRPMPSTKTQKEGASSGTGGDAATGAREEKVGASHHPGCGEGGREGGDQLSRRRTLFVRV